MTREEQYTEMARLNKLALDARTAARDYAYANDIPFDIFLITPDEVKDGADWEPSEEEDWAHSSC